MEGGGGSAGEALWGVRFGFPFCILFRGVRCGAGGGREGGGAGRGRGWRWWGNVSRAGRCRESGEPCRTRRPGGVREFVVRFYEVVGLYASGDWRSRGRGRRGVGRGGSIVSGRGRRGARGWVGIAGAGRESLGCVGLLGGFVGVVGGVGRGAGAARRVVDLRSGGDVRGCRGGRAGPWRRRGVCRWGGVVGGAGARGGARGRRPCMGGLAPGCEEGGGGGVPWCAGAPYACAAGGGGRLRLNFGLWCRTSVSGCAAASV